MNAQDWADRLYSKTVQDPDTGCWLWNAGKPPANGYPIFSGPVELAPEGKSRFAGAHRWSYIFANGPIPDGLDVDHLCNVRHCINPDHLEAIDHAENLRRRFDRQTHCKRGHERTEANTYRTTAGVRTCLPCKRSYRARLLEALVSA